MPPIQLDASPSNPLHQSFGRTVDSQGSASSGPIRTIYSVLGTTPSSYFVPRQAVEVRNNGANSAGAMTVEEHNRRKRRRTGENSEQGDYPAITTTITDIRPQPMALNGGAIDNGLGEYQRRVLPSHLSLTHSLRRMAALPRRSGPVGVFSHAGPLPASPPAERGSRG